MSHYPLRVLMIGPTAYALGDTTHSTFAIWRRLAQGFDRLKVLARANGAGGAWTAEGVEVELIRGVRRRELEFLASQFALVGRGRAFAPDVVVSQGVALGGWAAVRIAKRCGAGSLIEVHSDDHAGRAPILSRKGLMQRLSAPVFARATLIRVLSARMGEELVALYGSALREKIRVLPPRVDTKRFHPPAARKLPDGRLDLAMIGTLNANKGQLRLIDALERAGLPVTLHLFGKGPDHDAIDAIARAKGEGALRIVVHGHVTHDRLGETLAKCDALVMYSRKEGTPRAMMEAMATGLPVITTDAGFCADVIEHEREGVVLSTKETERDLASHLEAFLADPSRLRAMGDAALARARDEFAADKIYPRYRALIAEAAGR